MRVPSKITPDSILEAIVELRFIPNIPEEAIFGTIYGIFKDRISKTENLNALQIPESIRKSDPNLTFVPLYKLHFQDIFLQVGARSISFHSTIKYIGWDQFSKRIEELLKEIFQTKIIGNIQRLGIRYLNYFETQTVLQNSNLSVNLPTYSTTPISHNVILNYKKHDIGIVLKIYEGANVSIKIDNTQQNKTGSVIDIDCFIDTPELNSSDPDKINGLLTRAHEAEKEIFFNLLKEDYINSLNPEYAE